MRRLNRDKSAQTKRGSGGFVTVGVVLTVVGSMMATLFGAGAASRVLDVFDGNVWLFSASKGEVARVNSAAGRVDMRQAITDARNHRVQVIQTDKNLILRDLTTGKITSLDLATLGVSGALKSEPGDGITVVLHKENAFIIDSKRGAIRQVDPSKLSTIGKPVTLPAAVQGGAFDDDGKLWVAVPTEGTVVRVTPGKNGPSKPQTFPVTDTDHNVKLTVLDHGAAMVDQTKGALFTIRDDEVKQVEAPALVPTADVSARNRGDVVPVTLTDELRVVLEQQGKVSSFPVGAKSNRVGPAVAFNDRVYINDDLARSVLVYDFMGRELQEIEVPDANGPLELEVREEHLFINAPNSASARVIDSKHNVTPINKYPQDVLGSEKPAVSSLVNVPAQNNNAQQNPNGNKLPTKQSPPGAPGSVRALPGNKSARVNWTPAASNGAGISGYVIEGGGKSKRVSGRSRSAVVDGLDNGTEYSFKVHAVNAKGPGPHVESNKVTPTAEVPDPPASVQAQVDTKGAATITWPEADGQGTTIVNYSVVGTDAKGTQIALDPVQATRINVPAERLALGEDYTFTVVSNTNTGAQSQPSPKSNVVRPFTRPDAPVGVKAAPTRKKGELRVSWEETPNNGRPITEWIVSAAGQTQPVSGPEARGYTFTGLPDGQSITVTVKAKNEGGESDPATGAAATPGAPGVTITSTSTTEDSIRVNFSVADNGADVGSCQVKLGGKTANGCGGTATIDGLNPGQAYPIEVTATNDVGTGSDRSNATTKERVEMGTVRCINQPNTGDPNYCSDGVRVFDGPSQQNHRDVGAAHNGDRNTGTCRAMGNQSITAYVYNNNKTSQWWVKIGNGRFLPYVWINLDGGDAALNRLPTC